ncbi:MAG TPA: hypothetical protein VHE33_13835 [Acidobacteriaceae bacterium]|nr:hypothetical protein [Acidobacteriaceae bacterium]
MEPVHIVVQHVRRESRECFRLVAYRGVEGFWPVEFTSLDDLVQALRIVLPAFDRTQIAVAGPSEESSILWAGDLKLSDAELARIGLRKIHPRV